MASIATAYKALSRYELVQCLELFSGLPSHQMNTSWVFSQLARAHFEQGNYNEVSDCSIRVFCSYIILGSRTVSTGSVTRSIQVPRYSGILTSHCVCSDILIS